jgi:hypothetical protein
MHRACKYFHPERARISGATEVREEGMTAARRAGWAAVWVAAGAAVSGAAFAQGDGPRAYQILPDGTRLLTTYVMGLRGNQTAAAGTVVDGGDIDVDLAVAQYTQSFALAGRQAAAFGLLPYGEVSGRLDGPFDAIRGSSTGFGDPILGLIVGLVGPAPLTLKEFVAYRPGFALGALAKVTLPVGSYDRDRFLNVGGNRWALQLGVPMAWYVGESFLDPALTTIEFLPSVQVFGDNDDPRGADSTGQDPLLRIEAHLTRNVHQAVWLSLDGLYVHGGETSTDGRDNDDAQSAFELGATVGVAFSRTSSVKLSYGEVVSRNDGGPDGYMVRLIGTLIF